MTAQAKENIPLLAYNFDSLAVSTTINTTQLRADAKSGKLRGRRIGKRWIFLPEDVQSYLRDFPTAS